MDIFEAIDNGDINKVNDYIANQGDLLATKDIYCLPQYAFEKGHHNIVNLLVAAGAPVNDFFKGKYSSKDDIPLLHKYIELGLYKQVEFLLDNGADINISSIKNGRQISSLLAATESSQERIATLLIDRGVDLKKYNFFDDNVLISAFDNLSLTFVKDLIENRGYNIQSNEAVLKSIIQSKIDYDEGYVLKGIDFEKLGYFIANDKNLANQALLIASKNRKIDVVKYLIEEKQCNINYTEDRKTALVYAVENNNLNMLKLLLDNGAYVDKKDKHGYTPLINAIKNDKIEIAHYLIDNGADVNHQNNEDRGALFYSAMQNDISVTEKLLSKNAIIDDGSYQTPLLYAVMYKKLEQVKLLLKNGADIEAKDAHKDTPLMKSIDSITYHDKEGIAIALYLIDQGADINTTNKDNDSPLLKAIAIEELSTVLIDKGAKVNHQNDSGKTPLMFICDTNDAQTAKYLIDHQADMLLKSKEDATAFDYAINGYSWKTAMLDVLISEQIKQNKVTFETVKFLVEQGRFDVIKEASKTCDINVSDEKGKSMLFYAIKNNGTFKKLVKLGFDIHHQDNDGDTVLFQTVNKNTDALTQYLIDQGAAVNHKNKSGQTVLFKTTDQMDVLFQNGADVNIVDNNNENVLFKSSTIEYFVDRYIKEGVDINQQNSSGDTAAMARFGDTRYVEILIDRGADLSIANKSGETLLDLLKSNNRGEKIISLVERTILEQMTEDHEDKSMGL